MNRAEGSQGLSFIFLFCQGPLCSLDMTASFPVSFMRLCLYVYKYIYVYFSYLVIYTARIVIKKYSSSTSTVRLVNPNRQRTPITDTPYLSQATRSSPRRRRHHCGRAGQVPSGNKLGRDHPHPAACGRPVTLRHVERV